MEIAGQKLNTIEETLYKKELEVIKENLRKFGKQLSELFEPYYLEKSGLRNDFSKDFSEFIKNIAFADSSYCAGYYTKAGLNEYSEMPEQMKAAILKKICADFVSKVQTVEEVLNEIE